MAMAELSRLPWTSSHDCLISKQSLGLYAQSMKRFWLIATIIGTVLPYYFFIKQLTDPEFELSLLTGIVFPSYAATGFIVDLFVTSLFFWIYIFNKIDRKLFSVVVLLNLTIGLSAAMPFYFYKTAEK